jgi:hypothetical protein
MSEAWLIKILKKTFQVILIAFYIHYKPYEGILGKTSKTIKSLEIVCAEFKCKTDMINSL